MADTKITPGQILGVVLAGGESRRMGGTDKAGLAIGGKTLLQHVAARLAPQVGSVAVSTHADSSAADGLGLATLSDATSERQGPLAGILAALTAARATPGARAVATIAVDTPFFPADLVARLAEAADDRTIAAAHSGERLHPTAALFPVAFQPLLAAWLVPGADRSVRRWIEKQQSVVVHFADGADGDPFFNINTPDDLALAEAMLARLAARG